MLRGVEMRSPQRSPAPAATGSRAQQVIQHANHNPADTLLSRLDGVRETGPGRYLARCPAHDDGRPSLSLREASDGTLLVHCFAGCGAGEVMEAAGLTLADLFPDRLPDRQPQRRGQRRIPAADALVAIDREALVVSVIASDIRDNKVVTDDTFDRLATAAARIGAARELCGVRHG